MTTSVSNQAVSVVPPRIFAYGTSRDDAMSSGKWGSKMTEDCQACAARIRGYRLYNDTRTNMPFAVQTGNPKDVVYGRLLWWRNVDDFQKHLRLYNHMMGYLENLPAEQCLFDRTVNAGEIVMSPLTDRNLWPSSQNGEEVVLEIACIVYYRRDVGEVELENESVHHIASGDWIEYNQSMNFDDAYDFCYQPSKDYAANIADMKGSDNRDILTILDSVKQQDVSSESAVTPTHDSVPCVSRDEDDSTPPLPLYVEETQVDPCQVQFEKFLVNRLNMGRYLEAFKKEQLNDIRLVGDFCSDALVPMNPAQKKLFLRKCASFQREMGQFQDWLRSLKVECLVDVLEDKGIVTLEILCQELNSKEQLQGWIEDVNLPSIRTNIDAIVDNLWVEITTVFLIPVLQVDEFNTAEPAALIV